MLECLCAQISGYFVKQIVDPIDANHLEHLAYIFFGVRDKRHQGVRAIFSS